MAKATSMLCVLFRKTGLRVKPAMTITGALTLMVGAMLFMPLGNTAFAAGATVPAAASTTVLTAAAAPTAVLTAAESAAPVSDPTQLSGLNISADNTAATLDGVDFAVDQFSRSNKGTLRAYQDVDYGYRYPLAAKNAFAVLELSDAILVYIPQTAIQNPRFDIEDAKQRQDFEALLTALDAANSNGGTTLANSDLAYIYTTQTNFTHGGYKYQFALELESGYYYASIQVDDDNPAVSEPTSSLDPARAAQLCDTGVLKLAKDTVVTSGPQGLDALWEFLYGMDYRPFWVSLRTSLVAMLFVFVLGLAAARFSLGMNKRVQDILDAVFTIPMVLPPTVCGFLLLVVFGNSTSVGQWLIAHGIELVFSWPAAVLAAIVVAFPLMYRTSRGAFEAQDTDMLDAARTLGWKEPRIFFKLMLPLAWPSIAAGTVLAFARAMGEFGATLFVAGNYAGVTQTMPIAIYFQWMSGNTEVAVFWVFVVVLISFIVILFINLYASHTQRYRQSVPDAKVIKEDKADPKYPIPEEL